MKRVIAVAIGVLGLLAVAVGVSNADPGPNDLNDHGLCTAYFNGQKNGHEGDYPPPFAALEEAGNEHTDSDKQDNDGDQGADETTPPEHESLDPQENIYNFCADTTTIGGNPEHGRYTCTQDGVATPPTTDPTCEDNPAPGNS